MLHFLIELGFTNRRYSFAPVPERITRSTPVRPGAFNGETILRNVTARQPSVFKRNFADLPIDFHYYPASFRGKTGQTHLEIYFGLPASQGARLEADGDGLLVLDRGVTLHDSQWNEVHRVEDQIIFEMPSDDQIQDGAFIPSVLPVDLPPGSYHLSLQVRDTKSGKSQISEREITVNDYAERDALQLSDIELAFSISEADSDEGFVKHGLRIVPMPSQTFRKHQHPFAYFEIYNLTRDEYGQSHYRVEYAFQSAEKPSVPVRILKGLGQAIVSFGGTEHEIVVAYDRRSDTPDEMAYVELDLTEADHGQQRIRVTVTDLLTEKQASREVAFKVVP